MGNERAVAFVASFDRMAAEQRAIVKGSAVAAGLTAECFDRKWPGVLSEGWAAETRAARDELRGLICERPLFLYLN